ncbi:anti-anti-sigma factor [Saccharothrix tamanrassetensis]|uniref:Anti-sigma factor antagonist n=1 Tax=Saccharothrix tamanrassetensis TaxID=1051531 RepID=A0A841CAC1_9PSEU|nr:STAS domain-containing protein [Saccharothrix tamanrassetensis]MBB5954349.1 anti-anti-sigma factor [Saccharothrix tamanrassetensis]
MQVDKYMRGTVTVIALNGELDSHTAPEVQRSLDDLVPGDGTVVLDLSRMSYMSSAGLRVLLLVYRQARQDKVGLVLSCVPEDVLAMMSATGFLSFFTVTDTVDEGLEALAV